MLNHEYQISAGDRIESGTGRSIQGRLLRASAFVQRFVQEADIDGVHMSPLFLHQPQNVCRPVALCLGLSWRSRNGIRCRSRST